MKEVKRNLSQSAALDKSRCQRAYLMEESTMVPSKCSFIEQSTNELPRVLSALSIIEKRIETDQSAIELLEHGSSGISGEITRIKAVRDILSSFPSRKYSEQPRIPFYKRKPKDYLTKRQKYSIQHTTNINERVKRGIIPSEVTSKLQAKLKNTEDIISRHIYDSKKRQDERVCGTDREIKECIQKAIFGQVGDHFVTTPKNLKIGSIRSINMKRSSSVGSSLVELNGVGKLSKSAQVQLVKDFAEFKQLFEIYLRKGKRTQSELKEQFTQMVNKNICCFILDRYFNNAYLVQEMRLEEFNISEDHRNGLSCMMADFKKYILNENTFNIGDLQAKYAISYAKSKVAKAKRLHMLVTQSKTSILRNKKFLNNNDLLPIKLDVGKAACFNRKSPLVLGLKYMESQPGCILESVNSVYKDKNKHVSDGLQMLENPKDIRLESKFQEFHDILNDDSTPKMITLNRQDLFRSQNV